MKAKKSKPPRLMNSRHSALLKNLQKSAAKYRGILIVVGYVLLFVVASYVFYRRYPTNYTHPNFYAEDGSIFAKNIIGHGFFNSILTTFNGYYIWGIYLLEKIGFIINQIFYGGQFADLPRSFALTSYMFFGFIATLPALLFRKYLRPMAIVIATLLILSVPMLGWDYAIIGTIGNLKFAFVFIAFLLLMYRHLMPENSKKVYLVDAGLLICAYTNVTVYILLIFALLRYLPKLKTKRSAKKLLRDRTFQSLVGLGILLLPQLIVIKVRGVTELPGYLDNPYQLRRSIEIFISRSYLYGLFAPVTKFFNDAIVLLLIAGAAAMSFYTSKRTRLIFWFGIFAVFMTTLTFVMKRTGISDFYPNYKAGGGPDQFFYTQNWIFSFVFSIVVVELLAKLRSRFRYIAYTIIICIICFGILPRGSTYGTTGNTGGVGTIYAIGQASCKTKASTFTIPVYPSSDVQYEGVTRQQLCTPDVINYQPDEVSLGLTPYNNTYLTSLGVSNHFSQTFVSPENNLNGIGVYFSTFLAKVRSPYSLTLYAADCKTPVRSVNIHTGKIRDNSYYDIPFEPIRNSANKTYCFTINSNRKENVDALAIQLSKEGSYPKGQTIINSKPGDKDIVFDLHYK